MACFFRLRGYHPLWHFFPKVSAKNIRSMTQSYNPGEHAHRFGLLRFRSPLLAESLLVFFSSPYLDVSVQGVRDVSSCLQHDRLTYRDYEFIRRWFRMTGTGFPHSDIRGSQPACGYPRLIAACGWVSPFGNLRIKVHLPTPRTYRDWETDRKSTRLNSSHSAKSRMPSSA